MNNIELHDMIGSIIIGTCEHNGCLATAIASHLAMDIGRPFKDQIDENTDWGKWVIEQTNATLDNIAEIVLDESLPDRDRKRDAALLRECILPNEPVLQAHLEELARLRESGEWEPTL